jgi:hypothetical protein
MFAPNCRKLAKDYTKTKNCVEMRRNFLSQKNLFLAIKIEENKEFLSNFCGSKFCQDMPPKKKKHCLQFR